MNQDTRLNRKINIVTLASSMVSLVVTSLALVAVTGCTPRSQTPNPGPEPPPRPTIISNNSPGSTVLTVLVDVSDGHGFVKQLVNVGILPETADDSEIGILVDDGLQGILYDRKAPYELTLPVPEEVTSVDFIVDTELQPEHSLRCRILVDGDQVTGDEFTLHTEAPRPAQVKCTWRGGT